MDNMQLMYSKSFLCEITVYPNFHKDQYSGYIKEQFNEWITECFRAYTAMFKLHVIQHGVKIYMYESDMANGDINLKKLWQNQFGTYTIQISGDGIVMKGTETIKPPINIAEAMVDKITFRYKEYSDISAPLMIAYGKGVGLPQKYTRENTWCEEWNNGFSEYDVFCPNFSIDIVCSNYSFDRANNIIRAISFLNEGESCNIATDPYGLNIKISSSFHLIKKHKPLLLKALNSLCELVIEDDNMSIDEFRLDFASASSDFSLESYLFNEKDGRIDVKYITMQKAG